MKLNARSLRLASAGLLSTLCLSSCDQALLSASNRVIGDAGLDESDGGPSLLEKKRFAEALEALVHAVGDQADTLVFDARRRHLVLQVRSRDRPREVVEFRYRDGRVIGPRHVELRGPGRLEKNLFALELRSLGVVPELAATAVRRVDPDHGRASRVLLRRALPASEGVAFRAYVDSPLRSGHVDADVDGRVSDEP